MTFSAVTYNVLAQSFVRPDRYPLCPREALDPARRRGLLLDRVEALDADLLCLQELEPAEYEDLRARLAATHDAVYARRSRRPDGLAVFARHTRFGGLEPRELRFAAQRPGGDDLALIVRLTLDGQPLHVACTHLAWQPESTPRDEHVGRRQMLELLAHRDATAPDATWILAGDFNATSRSNVVAAALERGMDESCRTQRPWDTCAINGRPRKIDYLLFSEGRLAPRPGALPELSRDSALPSLTEPSDHLPLRVDFSATP
ncbi:endonuclease/exonuclease/phosphatase family protein [Yinghuangia soli]|uniref:Endonuclease/exonuclease/phosphatase family protein n=1 Tax=Yinghuangia soli TaxID=2908204 RepID=A0AA41U5D2_9ACTN|nr:endonuclease/exonuclease/phosphatase family protein [Yinghuangia soli]MCF2531797.1 endonuclease/exonuclease/phosphatase family protein [Yinghuangia soli]